MKKVIFVCHGSICRSPAAEMIFRNEIKKAHRENEFEVTSMALSNEEIGNGIYPPMRNCLYSFGIPMVQHVSRRLTQKDLDDCDYLFYMDDSNKRILSYLINDIDNKCKPVFYYTPHILEIEDPWYSDRYDLVVKELTECIKDILLKI
ncbi:MAG: low molecular weight phosphotyrosine protein phosphatase [Bacilli bacterium]|nr:low molecular weight phosphotyrosine protein phosphatase [Bacilli bacterium]